MYPSSTVNLGWFVWFVSYKLRDKHAIGRRRWNITTQERKVCDVEIEIMSFVVDGSVKLTIPPNQQKYI